MWSEQTIKDVQINIIAVLLNYDKHNDIEPIKRDILENDNKGWVFLDTLQKRIPDGKKYLTDKKAYEFFRDLDFIECRTRKTPNGYLKYRYIGKTNDTRPHKDMSAYRLKRTVTAWKHLIIFERQKDIISKLPIGKNDYDTDNQDLQKKTYEEYYDMFEFSKREENRELKGIRLAISNPKLFGRYLEDPKEVKENIKYFKELMVSKKKFTFEFVHNAHHYMFATMDSEMYEYYNKTTFNK